MGCTQSKSVSHTSAAAPSKKSPKKSTSPRTGGGNRKSPPNAGGNNRRKTKATSNANTNNKGAAGRTTGTKDAPKSPRRLGLPRKLSGSPKKKPQGTNRPQNGGASSGGNQPKQRQQPLQPIDDAWTSLWESLHHAILDPADVYSFMGDVMANTTDRLSPAEITFLIRRIRQVTRTLPKQSTPALAQNKMIGRFMNNNKQHANETLEGRTLVEKLHQMDEAVLKKVFYAGHRLLKSCRPTATVTATSGSSSKGNSKSAPKAGMSLDLLGATYVLAAHLSCEAFWTETTDRAAAAAEQAGLVLDVNMATMWEGPPPKPIGTRENAPPDNVEVTGASTLSVAFLVALGLREYDMSFGSCIDTHTDIYRYAALVCLSRLLSSCVVLCCVGIDS